MSGFKNKELRGVTYDMSHLTNYTMQVQHGQNNYNVGVQFSCHCFTRKAKQGDPLEILYRHEHENRAFDVDRFNLSLLLPNYIAALPNHEVYHDDKDSFLIIRLNGGDYTIFLKIHQATLSEEHDVILRVNTAHIRNDFYIRKPPYRFTRIVHLLANGAVIPKEKKRHITRL